MLQSTRGMWLVWLAAVLVNIGGVIYVGINPTPKTPHDVCFVPGLATVTELTIDGQQVQRDGKPIELVACREYKLKATIMLTEGEFIQPPPDLHYPHVYMDTHLKVRNAGRIRGLQIPYVMAGSAKISSDHLLADICDTWGGNTILTTSRTATTTISFTPFDCFGKRDLVFSLERLPLPSEEEYFEMPPYSLDLILRPFDRFPILVVEPGDDCKDSADRAGDEPELEE